VNESTQYWDKYLNSTDTETARKNIEERIKLQTEAKNHVLLSIELADTYIKKKYAELLAESLEYSIKSDEKILELINHVENGDEEGAKALGEDSDKLMKIAGLKLMQANAYLDIIREREGE